MKSKSKWIRSDQVEAAAKRKEKENLRFRSFLKRVADEQDLDRRFLRLHKEIFPNYDCNQCRNCCKLLCAEIPVWDIEKDAEALGLPQEKFVSEYLEQSESGSWKSKTLPCSLLDLDGSCKLGDCRPESCKKFPYTDQPERLLSLYSVLNAVEVCPAAYEIFEALKREYGFDSHGRNRKSEETWEDGGFSFVAGYTSGGFPYGVLREEEEESEEVAEELPF